MQKNIIKVRIINPASWYREMKYHVYEVYEQTNGGFYRVASEGRFANQELCKDDVIVVNAQAMAFAVPTEERSRFVQLALIAKDYVWASYGGSAKSVHNTKGSKYITTDDRGCIRMCKNQSDIPKNTPFYDIKEIMVLSFTPAEMVEIDGTQYLKSHVINALKLMEGIDV